jgi:hypothetical protein
MQSRAACSIQHAADFINGFGSGVYDRVAPLAFKNLFWKLMDNSSNHSPGNNHANGRFEHIRVLRDDPTIPGSGHSVRSRSTK